MPAKVAVVCASHNSNSGMYSVDLAARSYLNSKGLEHTFFLSQINPAHEGRFGTLAYERYEKNEDLSGFTHILFWGDFLSNPVYGQLDYSFRDVEYGHSVDRAAGRSRWRELFSLFEHRDSVCASIGGNFQHNFEDGDATIVESLRDIQERIAAFWPRDHFSAKNLARYVPFNRINDIHLGLDCAFLLPPEDEAQSVQQFSYMFFRSKLGNMSPLIEKLETSTGCKALKINNWLTLDHRTAERDFRISRRQISNSRFVLTDTYHVCVNSMACGVPVIGLGRAQGNQSGTLGDFKKWTLFNMMGLGDFYFEIQPEQDMESFLADVQERLPSLIETYHVSRRIDFVRFEVNRFRRELDSLF